MPNLIPAQSASLLPTSPSASLVSWSAGQLTNAPSSNPAQVFSWQDFYRADDVPVPDGFIDIDEVLKLAVSDPVVRDAVERARTRIADALPLGKRGLAYLRLRRGWSQKQLADAIGTSQPHIARIESGRGNVFLETANQLAQALNVTLLDINSALGYGDGAE